MQAGVSPRKPKGHDHVASSNEGTHGTPHRLRGRRRGAVGRNGNSGRGVAHVGHKREGADVWMELPTRLARHQLSEFQRLPVRAGQLLRRVSGGTPHLWSMRSLCWDRSAAAMRSRRSWWFVRPAAALRIAASPAPSAQRDFIRRQPSYTVRDIRPWR